MILMLEGRCPQCGQYYIGRALADSHFQTCDKCGAALDIKDGEKVIRGSFFSSSDNSVIETRNVQGEEPGDS